MTTEEEDLQLAIATAQEEYGQFIIENGEDLEEPEAEIEEEYDFIATTIRNNQDEEEYEEGIQQEGSEEQFLQQQQEMMQQQEEGGELEEEAGEEEAPAPQNYLQAESLIMNENNVEIGKHAVWSLSTAKHGNGVQQLRDGNAETFWQSDGTQPHYVNVQFPKIMQVAEVCLYLDYKLDESYTPKQISIRTGFTHHDLKEIQLVELSEPCGWITIPVSLRTQESPLDESSSKKRKTFISANLLQLAILSNHQNGRDTHIRQIKVFGPSPKHYTSSSHRKHLPYGFDIEESTTPEISMFSCIR